MRRLKVYWNGMLFLPLLYLAICLGVETYWFEKKNMMGFLPLSRDGSIIIWAFLIIAALAGSFAIYFLEERFEHMLDEAGEEPEEFFRILFRRLLILGAICDAIAFLGLLSFLCNADILMMAAMGLYSYGLYARIHPNERVLKKLRLLAPTKGNGADL